MAKRKPVRLLPPDQAAAFVGDVRDAAIPALARRAIDVAWAENCARQATALLTVLVNAPPHAPASVDQLAEVCECLKASLKIAEAELQRAATEGPIRIPRFA